MADERLGASFSIDTTNLRAGLQQANRLIRESESQFRAAASGLDNWSKSEEGLTKRQKSLTDQIDIQKKKVAALAKEKQNIIDKMTTEGKSNEEIEKAVDGVNKQIASESKALDRLKNDLDKTNTALDDLSDESDEAGKSVEDVGEKAEKTSGAFTVMKGALANLVADGFRAAISKAKELSTEMITVGASFDTAMSQISAVSGATSDDLEKIRDKAKEMGSTTKFTATEAAEAFNYMAMAGWKTEDMLGGIEGILNLAAAAGADLATTSDIVTDALTAMGYKAEDAGRLADVMAAASSNANTNVEMMGATFKYAAPIVGAMGYSMEDTAVAIGLMANAGIKGEMAGTALRSVMTRLAAPPKEAADAMETLGISITDNDGKMKSLQTVMEELRKKFDGLSETEQTQIAKNLAGAEAMSGLLAIVNAAPADFDKLTDAVAKSDGAASNMADTMIDNLGGDMTILKSQIEGVQIQLYEKFVPTLRNGVSQISKYLGKVDWDKFGKKAATALKNVIDKGKKLAKEILPPIKTVGSAVAKVIGFLIDNFSTLAPVVLTAVTAFNAFKAAMAVSTAITAAKTAISGLSAGVGLATKAQTGWNAAMSANPIGAVLTAVGLLTAGVALLASKNDEAKASTYGLTEEQKNSITATTEAKQAYDELKQSAVDLASAESANIDYTKSLWGELQTLADENGKVKEGYEGRAAFILNELNSALGTEYTMNGNVIQSYKDIASSIDDVIEKKKAQILLEAYEESYREAVQKVGEAELKRAEYARQLAETQTELETAQKNHTEAVEYYDSILTTASMNEITNARERMSTTQDEVNAKETALSKLTTAYNTQNGVVEQYHKDITGYETASTLVLQGETQKAIDALSNLGTGFQTAENTAYIALTEGKEKQKKILEQQVIDTEVNAKLMKQKYEDGVEGVTEQMVKTAQEQADKAKEEFKNVGGNITKGIAEGAENEENTKWTLSGAMQRLIDKAIAAANKAADSHSPSRRFRKKVGIFLPQGIARGIDDGTSTVIKSVKKQVGEIEKAYNFDDFSNSVDVGINTRAKKSSSINDNTTPAPKNGNVVINQTNNYSQAHSRYELYKSRLQTVAAVRLAVEGV